MYISLESLHNNFFKFIYYYKIFACMYVCISLYSLPFTGFESLPESVQTNLSKSPRNPQSNLPRDMEPLLWR